MPPVDEKGFRSNFINGVRILMTPKGDGSLRIDSIDLKDVNKIVIGGLLGEVVAEMIIILKFDSMRRMERRSVELYSGNPRKIQAKQIS